MSTQCRIARPAPRIPIMVAALAAVTVGLMAAGADARASGPQTFTTTISIPAFASSPPYVMTYGGTFTAAGTVSDSGTVSTEFHFDAVPSPRVGVGETTQTLTGAEGTVVLRCSQISKSDPLASTGSCAILSATGAYAGMSGAAKLTGVIVPPPPPQTLPLTFTDTIVLGGN
jgi:hypothetical protein